MNQLKVVQQYPVSEFVFMQDQEVVTDSLTIAQMFGKRHDHVMEDIRKQIGYAGKEFSLPNFRESNYQSRGKQYHKYDLTEEAFTLVVFGYNTKEAVQVKIKFIQEFKRIKEYIKSQIQQPKLPTTFAEALRLAADLEEEKQQLLIENQTMKPKAEYHDIVLDSTGTYTATQIANELGTSAIRLNRFLHQHRVQRKVGGQWILYAEHQGKGYTDTKTFLFDKTNGSQGSNQHLLWTEKGRKFIHSLFKEKQNRDLKQA